LECNEDCGGILHQHAADLQEFFVGLVDSFLSLSGRLVGLLRLVVNILDRFGGSPCHFINLPDGKTSLPGEKTDLLRHFVNGQSEETDMLCIFVSLLWSKTYMLRHFVSLH